jgi:hypothetical protein
MDAYQRGNRDGLHSLAKWAEEMAKIYQAEYDRVSENIGKNSLTGLRYELTASQSLFISKAYKDVASHARRMAEALPIDPITETNN